MTPERWGSIKEIALEAIDLEPSERTAFLGAACGDDIELLQSVEKLLRAGDADSGDTIERAIGAAAAEVEGRDTASEQVGLIGRRISHYRIVEKIGQGGMGVVYKAHDTKLQRPVALKFLSRHFSKQEEKKRFLREAQAAAAVNHANICPIHEIDEFEGQVFFAMAFIEGQTVDELAATRKMPIAEVLDIAIQVAGGLEAAHEQQIVHRDVKSQNIIVDDKGRAAILDFGLAQIGGGAKLTKTGVTMGTAPYMSPEQAAGEEIDARSDIWSLGVVIYEMAAGRLPFDSEYPLAILYSIVNETPVRLDELRPDAPAELADLVDRALQKKREDRYQRVEDLAVDLRALQRSLQPGEATAVSPRRRRATKKTRVVAAAVLAALAVLLVALGLYWVLTPAGEPLPSEVRLAILPFTLEGPNAPSREYADGLAATVSERVAAFAGPRPDFSVLPPSEALRLNGKEPTEAGRRLGANLVLTGNLVYSEEALQAAVDLFSPDRGRVVRRGTFEIARGDPVALREQLVAVLLEILDIPPPTEPEVNQEQNATAYGYYVEGRGYLLDESQLSSIEKAISLFHRAHSEDDEYGLAWAGLARAYLRKWALTKEENAFNLARSAANTAIAYANDVPQAHIAVGHVHLGSGRSEEAIANFGRALDLDPGNPDALIGMGRAYEANQAIEEAESTLTKAIALRPNLWTGYKWLGLLYYNQGRYREAIDQYEKILELAPRSVHALLNLGGFHAYLDELAEARRFWEEAVAIEPDADVLANLAKLAYDQGDYSASARRYEQAAALRPNRHQIWGNLAASYLKADRKGDAASAYGTAIEKAEQELEINSQDAAVIAYLGHYHATVGDVEAAMSLTARALALTPTEPHVLVTTAETYGLLGELDLAGPALASAVEHGFSLDRVRGSERLRVLLDDPKWKSVLEAAATGETNAAGQP